MNQRQFKHRLLVLLLAVILLSGSSISYAQDINENQEDTLINTLDNSALSLTVKLPPNGRELTLADIAPESYVSDLKDQIQAETGIDSSIQTLSIQTADVPSQTADIVLEDQKTLAEYALQSGTVLYLTESIALYHTNDMHGALAPTGDSLGLAKTAALKKSTPGAILADAGDATQGLPLASLSKGKDIISLMNTAGYDVMAAGNHEFDFGQEQLLANADLARFPILSANVLSGGTPFFQGHGAGGTNTGCHTIIERGDIKIGFFGLTTCETTTSTNPTGLQGLIFEDEIETAKKEIDELEDAGADMIVALAHLGEYNSVPCTSKQLADAMTGEYEKKLDVIIDGHSHTEESFFSETGILIQQTGTGLAKLGKVTLHVTTDRNTDRAEGLLIPTKNGDTKEDKDLADALPDSQISAEIERIQNAQKDLLSEEICEVKNSLWGGKINGYAVPRITETNLGDFTADAYKHAAEHFLKTADGLNAYQNLPVTAVENGGGIRSSIPGKTMTMEHLVSAFPFSNTLRVKVITPDILYSILEKSVSSITGQDASTGTLQGEPNGGFLQVSGFSFVYDPASAAGAKVKSVTLDGQTSSLDRSDTSTSIVLVSNNFIMDGGNGYTELETQNGKPKLLGEIGGELEILQAYIDYCTDNGTKPLDVPTSAGRIRIDGSYKGTEYEAAFSTRNTSGKSARSSSIIPVYVDGSATPSHAVIGSDGIARITLPNGPHSISLLPDGEQIYVDNYTGDGLEGVGSRPLPSLLSYKILITAPSENELKIAPERSFYVKGIFGSKLPDQMKLSVSIINENGALLREVSSEIKQNPNLKSDAPTYCNKPELLTASGMPDLVWDGITPSSFHNGDLKCWYDDNGFTALIPGGKANGSAALDDQMNLVDSLGRPYSPLPSGQYKIRAAIILPDGSVHSETFKDIEIGSVSDKILARFSPDSHLQKVSAFADVKGYRIYKDFFPGYWSMDDGFFCEIAPEWRAADATEYTTGKVHFVIYNVRDTSTTYSLELGLLQSMNDIDNPDRLKCYYYTTGEPEVIGQTESGIAPFADGDKLQFVRAVSGKQDNKEGVYIPDSPQETAYDMNINDGITVSSDGTIALYGVTAPIQASQSDIKINGDNTYTISNKIKTIQYHITGDGVDETYEKKVLLNRPSNGKDNYSELEFKHVFNITGAMAGKTLKITAKGFDAHNKPVDGTDEELLVTISKEQAGHAPGSDTHTGDKAAAAAKTGDDAPILPLFIILAATTAVFCYCKAKRTASH